MQKIVRQRVSILKRSAALLAALICGGLFALPWHTQAPGSGKGFVLNFGDDVSQAGSITAFDPSASGTILNTTSYLIDLKIQYPLSSSAISLRMVGV
jgi:hypothetical protein